MREDILQALSELIKEKTELKAEKIELNAIDDLNSLVKKFTSKIVSDYESIIKEQDKLLAQYDNLDSDIKKIKSKAEVQYKAYNKNEQARLKILGLIEKQAKELGINPMNIKEVKKAVQASDSNSRIYKTYDIIEKYKQLKPFW